MLNRLGRWLRAAGYDTAIAQHGDRDRELLAQARDEHRLFITRDRKILEHKNAANSVLLLEENGVHDCAAELAGKIAIDWLYRPFSRCLECNAELELASETQRARIPADARSFGDDIYYCSHCDQVYWPGSHVRRMYRKLREWQTGDPDDTDTAS